jgi:hypothetical protein
VGFVAGIFYKEGPPQYLFREYLKLEPRVVSGHTAYTPLNLGKNLNGTGANKVGRRE